MKLKTIFIITLPIITGILIYLFSKSYFEKNAEPDDFSAFEFQTAEVNTPDTYITKFSAYSDEYNIYTNNPYGYEIVLLNTLILNEDIVSVKSRFESDNLVVDVLYDDFAGTPDSNKTYNNYGNKGIKENPEFEITDEYDDNYHEINTHFTFYERKSNNLNDKNYYATIAFERSKVEIVTVFIKSSQSIDINYIIPMFRFIDKNYEMKSNKVFKPVKKKFDILTQQFYDQYFIDNKNLSFGVFEPSFPAHDENLKILEEMFDYNFPVVLLYNRFELPYKDEQMNNAKKHNKVVEYTLYTMDKVDGKEKDITLDILDGKYDDYLNDLAIAFKEYNFPVLFRLNNEMNGGWVTYSAFHIGKDTDLYIDCWKYIYNKFKEHDVNNLIFVWNPNERDFPNYAYNHYLNYYPGDEYVDIVGLTAYNTGNYYEGESWRSFNEAYDHFYYEYENQFEHPFMITEFSCAEAGGDKPSWFDDMFNKIAEYDKIKLAVLWNGQDFDMTKTEKTISRNYRLDLDEDVINSIKNGLKKYK
ncbi:glycosyl hydrolase [Sedimentibacter sp.]|uniref:glycoside hydrolase family 26 protein n=1 Tax=Sedimentibacter sp. TaxID=1960295 RepID=UPI0028A86E61|nr:glycosyl hydrolase [Sedimentibacter sp.]